MKQISIGIDVGGTNTAIGVVDELGNVLNKTTFPTPAHGHVEHYLDEIEANISVLVIEEQEADLTGIGIGAPDANHYKGTIENSPNLSFSGIIPFVDLLKKRLPQVRKIIMTNDANAATMGEMIYGGAKGMKNFAMYTLGTGVGFAMVVNGALVYGHDGFAGECGHNVLSESGRDCDCGMKGCLEAYCSANGIVRTALELLAEKHLPNSLLKRVPYEQMSSKVIFEAAKAEDLIAKEVFQRTGKYLARAISITAHHISPEAVFLFGGPVSAGHYIIEPLSQYMDHYLFPAFRGKLKILPSALPPGDAAILGAAALVS